MITVSFTNPVAGFQRKYVGKMRHIRAHARGHFAISRVLVAQHFCDEGVFVLFYASVSFLKLVRHDADSCQEPERPQLSHRSKVGLRELSLHLVEEIAYKFDVCQILQVVVGFQTLEVLLDRDRHLVPHWVA